VTDEDESRYDEEHDGHPRRRTAQALEKSLADGCLRSLFRDEGPADQVGQDAEAAEEGEDGKGDPDPEGIDAQVGGDASGNAGDLAVGAAPDERGPSSDRALPGGVRPGLSLGGAVHGFLLWS
jgi:hypothetical protein